MLTLYDYLDSGNGYKVRLILRARNIPFRRVELDIDQGETRTPSFLAKNPAGRVPAVEFDDGRILAESNAILWYFAEESRYLPRDSWARAQILQWLFFEQYSHEPAIAVARYIVKHLPKDHPRWKTLEALRVKGHEALAIMEARLTEAPYLVGDELTIADLALFAYTHVAEEGGMDTSAYRGIAAWLNRIVTWRGYSPIEQP